MQEEINYEEAIKKLEEIVYQLESGQMSIDVMATQLKEAQQLFDFCQNKLYAVEAEIQKILGKE